MECYYPKRPVRGESRTGMKHPLKAQGFVRTPPFIAALLARWALRTPTDHVLDAGFGEGVFLLESTRRLLALGASVQHLAAQLHGVDSQPDAVQGLQRTFRSYGLPTALPGVHAGDFFETDFPLVDVLIGNPPYVRRWWQKDVDALQVIAEQGQDVRTFSRLTDLACYFVIYGARFLKPGGRLALIVSDSWLDMRYGTAFKDYLLRTFRVRGMLGFQSQVFPDVLVRPVIILAEKRVEVKTSGRERVAFVSLNGRIPKTIPLDPCRLLTDAPERISGTIVRLDELRPAHNWTPLLYAPRVYTELLQHPGMTPLADTNLLRYIQYWENQVLNPRGLARPVIGVQNLPRVGKTRRTPWYNLLGDLIRRGTAPILLPRRIYQRYQVVWNQAAWVAGENFIEVMPHPAIPLLPLLAILNAGTTEVAVRANAHVYGGGVYNLSPGSVGDVPVLDVRQLAPATLHQLEDAYRQFLQAGGKDRTALDTAVLAALDLPTTFLTTLQAALDSMQGLSSAVQEPVSIDAAAGSGWPEELRLL